MGASQVPGSIVHAEVRRLGHFGPVLQHADLVIAVRQTSRHGVAKPMDTWYPAGPNSWKKLGSPIRRKESWAFCPSKVLVWSHSSPFAIRSAAGVATTPYLPGIMLATTACPASGDRIVPPASNFGQVTMVPVMPVCVGSATPIREIVEIGHASKPVEGAGTAAIRLVNERVRAAPAGVGNISKGAVRVQGQRALCRRRSDLNAIDVGVVGDHALGWIPHGERMRLSPAILFDTV